MSSMSSLRELIVCGAEVEACGIDLTPEDEEVEAPTLKTQAAGAVERCTVWVPVAKGSLPLEAIGTTTLPNS